MTFLLKSKKAEGCTFKTIMNIKEQLNAIALLRLLKIKPSFLKILSFSCVDRRLLLHVKFVHFDVMCNSALRVRINPEQSIFKYRHEKTHRSLLGLKGFTMRV